MLSRTIVVSLALLFVAGANAAPVGPPVTYLLDGTFSDGGTLTGSFTFQADNCSPACSTYTDIVLTTTSGTEFAGFTYTPENQNTGGTFISAAASPLTLTINFAESLWSGSSVIAISSGQEYSSATKGQRTIVSGTLTAVPLPAAVWLLASALAGLGWLRRKQTV